MDTKLFAIKIPENEKIAMDYISNITNNTLSKMFYKPLQEAIFKRLGLILLYKIDLRNSSKISGLNDVMLTSRPLSANTLPIIEDFVNLMLDKNLKKPFWEIFGDVEQNEKDFFLYEVDIEEMAYHLGKKYLENDGDFDKLDLNMARNVFFNYMLETYFNMTAIGSINKLNQRWSNRQPMIKQFQSQILTKYLNKFQPAKIEAIRLDDIIEVAEYKED